MYNRYRLKFALRKLFTQRELLFYHTQVSQTMTNIHSGVEEIIKSPQDKEVTLIVGISSLDNEDIQASIRAIGGDIEQEVPINCLAVTISEKKVQDLSDINGVQSIEIESSWQAAEGADMGNSTRHKTSQSLS